MVNYQILYWYDIPIQVRVRDESGRLSKPLPQRFQTAIDNAAMQAGLTGEDAYSDLFKWSEPQERSGTPDQVLRDVISELEAQYAQIDWHETANALKK